MTAEEVMRAVRDMSEEERNKVLYGLMKDFNNEMMKSSEFKHHAIDAMHHFIQKRKDAGEDISEFKAVLK